MIQDVQQSIQLGQDPDPATVNMLVEMGPAAIEGWVDSFEGLEGEADVIQARIDQLRERKESRIKSAERMRQALIGVLLQSFDGKVKTPLVTVWVQQKEGKLPSLRVRR
jgi:hypothetical protein